MAGEMVSKLGNDDFAYYVACYFYDQTDKSHTIKYEKFCGEFQFS